ncbi:MAG TPA: TolC family protein [Candidatus Ventrimonas merdavium]|nr:TolC family protein [Candidatus Ventrimonas merdavium]
MRYRTEGDPKRSWQAVCGALALLLAFGPGPAQVTGAAGDGAGLSAAFAAALSRPVQVWAAEDGAEVSYISYDSLRELVMENANLQDSLKSYTTSRENYQTMLDSLRESRDNMKFLAEKYEDTEEEAGYRSNAAVLSSSITQMEKQLARLDSQTQSISREKTIDTYVRTAQSLMRTYNQMALNEAAQEKNLEAAQASYDAAVKRQAAGMATAEEVLAAADALAQAENLAGSYRQQTTQARNALLVQLGISTESAAEIGPVSQPDLEAIDSIDPETDREKAVNNQSSVQSARRTSAVSMGEVEQKARNEATAESAVRAEFEDTYQQLLSSRSAYQASADAYAAAQADWQAAQRKNQAGMLSRTEYLQAESSFLSAEASKETASMDLVGAWEDYQYLVKGV